MLPRIQVGVELAQPLDRLRRPGAEQRVVAAEQEARHAAPGVRQHGLEGGQVAVDVVEQRQHARDATSGPAPAHQPHGVPGGIFPAPAKVTAANTNRPSVRISGARRRESSRAVIAASSSRPSTRRAARPVHSPDSSTASPASAPAAARCWRRAPPSCHPATSLPARPERGPGYPGHQRPGHRHRHHVVHGARVRRGRGLRSTSTPCRARAPPRPPRRRARASPPRTPDPTPRPARRPRRLGPPRRRWRGPDPGAAPSRRARAPGHRRRERGPRRA